MKYDHHADPAIAYCIEVAEIEALLRDVELGVSVDRSALASRISNALQFRVGGDEDAVAAKRRLYNAAGKFEVTP